MNRSTDMLIRKALKNWVAQNQPPENGRARLLWKAAHLTAERSSKFDLTSLFPSPDYHNYHSLKDNEWSRTLFEWIFESSFHAGMQARVC